MVKCGTGCKCCLFLLPPSLCSCSCVVWVTLTSTTGDNTPFTRMATVPTIPSYSGSGRYAHYSVTQFETHNWMQQNHLNFVSLRVSGRFIIKARFPPSGLRVEVAGLVFEDQSLFGRTGLFALMKVVPAPRYHLS